jgi:hypothetical protein
MLCLYNGKEMEGRQARHSVAVAWLRREKEIKKNFRGRE